MENFFNTTIAGNTLQQYAIAFLYLLVLVLVFKFFQMAVVGWLKRVADNTKLAIDDLAVSILEKISIPFYFLIAFYISSEILVLSAFAHKIIRGIFILTLSFEMALILNRIVDYVVRNKARTFSLVDGEVDREKEAILRLMGQIFKIFIWILVFIFILANLGVDVGSLIAGMGIGGIILALAVKDIIGDLFASFTIFIDKPFKVGDYVKISNEEEGTVEKITVKTTHIRTLEGQLLIITNKKLTGAVIENFQAMNSRRSSLMVSLACDTPMSKLKKVPRWFQEIVEEQKKAEFVRVSFREIGQSSFNFKIIFKVLDSKYAVYDKVKNNINYKIVEKLRREKVALAFPVQEIVIKK